MFKPNRIRNITTPLNHAALIQRVRILLIDDHPLEFPAELLRKEGYAIDIWEDVKDLGRLESGFYDIIVLDIGGVGSELSADEGLGVLRHLKAHNPSQVVVAYSGQSYAAEKIPFFDIADDFMPKPASFLKWKIKLDDIIYNNISILHYWNALHNRLVAAERSEREIRSLEKLLVKEIRSGHPRPALPLVQAALGHIDNVATIAAIVGKIIGLASA